MKNLIKTKEDLSWNICWIVNMNMQISELIYHITSQFSIEFVHRNDKNFIFQLWESKSCLKSTLNKCKIIFSPIYFDMGTCFYMFEQKMKKKKGKKVRRWHHQLTHLHCHIDSSRNVMWKFLKLYSFIFPLFLIRFSYNFHYSKLGLELSFKLQRKCTCTCTVDWIQLQYQGFNKAKWMDSFGIDYIIHVVQIKWSYFPSLNHNFIVLCELLMPCQLFAIFSLPMLIPSIDCKLHNRCSRFEWTPYCPGYTQCKP